jgi:hypothetical protein
VRRGGYLGVWTLLLATNLITRFGSARFDGDPPEDDWSAGVVTEALWSGALFFCLFVGYAAGFFILTSRRLGPGPRALSIATAFGVAGGVLTWTLAPFGALRHPAAAWLWPVSVLALVCLPPLVPLLAAHLVARRDRGAEPGPAGLAGVLAGVLAAGVGVLVLSVLGLISLRVAPDLVPLKWANPDPAVPHGTPFEVRMSVGDAAAGYLPVLIFGPLAGWILGVIGVALAQDGRTPAGGSQAS